MRSVDDFKRKAEEDAWEEPEEVTLPSGLTPILRRPRAMWFVLVFGNLPATLASRVTEKQEPSRQLEAEEIVSFARGWVRTFEGMFVEPVLRERPTEEQIGYRWIRPEDKDFLFRWAGGEIVQHGDLDAFRDKSESPGAGSDCGTLRSPAESVP